MNQFASHSPSRWQRVAPMMVGLAGIFLASLGWQFRLRFPFDDTFISFRYAEHVASGYGLVWNIGGPHTEGYTNFLFILMLAAAKFLTPNLLVAAQVIGLVSTIVTGFLIYEIASKVRDRAVGMLAAAFYLLVPLTWINALSGMETSLFVMWTVLAIFFAIRNQWFAAFSTVFLATLTRPEGMLLGGVLIVVALLQISKRTNGTEATNRFFPSIGPLLGSAFFLFVLPLSLYALWKLWYFGGLLPNSFYVKVLAGSHTPLPGLQYVRLFLESALVLIVLSCGIRGWRDKPIAIAALWSIALLIFYLFVLPLEGLYDRFLWPVFAMLCITGAIGAKDFATRLHLRSFGITAGVILIAHTVLSLISPRTRQALAAHEELWDASMDLVVQELKSLPHFDSLRLAYGDAGYVVYRSGVRHIDMFGLNDTRIAHAKSKEDRADILRSEQPDILLLPIYSRSSGIEWVEDAYGLAREPSFEAVATTEAFPYTLAWVLNTNSPYYRDCKTAIIRMLADSSGYFRSPPSTR